MVSGALKYIVFYVFLLFIFYGIDTSEKTKEIGEVDELDHDDHDDVFLESLYKNEKSSYKDLPHFRLWHDPYSKKFITLENLAIPSKGAVLEIEPKYAGVFKFQFTQFFAWEFPMYKIADDESKILIEEQMQTLQKVIFSTGNLLVKILFQDDKQINLIAVALQERELDRPTHLSVEVKNVWFNQSIPKLGHLFELPIVAPKANAVRLHFKNENHNALAMNGIALYGHVQQP